MRSVLITGDLRRTLIRDVVLYGLTRPRTLIVWVLIALVLMLEGVGFATRAAAGTVRPSASLSASEGYITGTLPCRRSR